MLGINLLDPTLLLRGRGEFYRIPKNTGVSSICLQSVEFYRSEFQGIVRLVILIQSFLSPQPSLLITSWSLISTPQLQVTSFSSPHSHSSYLILLASLAIEQMMHSQENTVNSKAFFIVPCRHSFYKKKIY